MKKLNFSLGAELGRMLSKDQMKKIIGGYGSKKCGDACLTDNDCSTLQYCSFCAKGINIPLINVCDVAH